MFITVLDMIDEKYHCNDKKYSKLIKHRKKIISSADHIIAISENTRQDIIAHFNIDPHKITTIHLGCSLEDEAIAAYKKDESTHPYALYIGSRKGAHKNFNNYLSAIEIIAKSNPSLQFVFGGGGNFTNEERDAISKKQLGNRIVYQPIHGDEDIIKLYKNAKILIYPSLYEGFGLPALEALQLGCRSLLSSTPALREVAGTCADYFTPGSIDELTNVLLKALAQGVEQNPHHDSGINQAMKFSWLETAKDTAKVYHSLI
jgi:glycosyltransferase involved in cell wall biosynthesis